MFLELPANMLWSFKSSCNHQLFLYGIESITLAFGVNSRWALLVSENCGLFLIHATLLLPTVDEVIKGYQLIILIHLMWNCCLSLSTHYMIGPFLLLICSVFNCFIYTIKAQRRQYLQKLLYQVREGRNHPCQDTEVESVENCIAEVMLIVQVTVYNTCIWKELVIYIVPVPIKINLYCTRELSLLRLKHSFIPPLLILTLLNQV